MPVKPQAERNRSDAWVILFNGNSFVNLWIRSPSGSRVPPSLEGEGMPTVVDGQGWRTSEPLD